MDTQHAHTGHRSGRGLILGKFMPPHRGHQFLVDFARHQVQHLTVLVCSLEREPIPGELRFNWMCELFPHENVDVIHVTDEVPQEPSEHPDFWAIWRDLIQRHQPRPIDWVFASEDYGWRLAETLGATFVPVDERRDLNPISGSMVRADPMGHWEMLPACVRPHFLRRIAVIGPESTGKSTLTRQLAEQFATVYAWEYARPLLDPKGGRCDPEDIPRIARGQLATERAMAPHANCLLPCDTNLLLTTIWAETLFGACPRWIMDAAELQEYDAQLLLSPDVPWVDDAQRYFPDLAPRRRFFEACRARLEEWGKPYVVIEGDWATRWDAACAEARRVLQPR